MRTRPLGLPRLHHRTLPSTNARAHELARGGADHGTLVTCDEQTAGRGRQGRAWTAPPGTAVLASWVVHEPSALVTLAAAVAVAEVAAELDGAGREPAIKWPNDVLLDGAKLCGILAEVVPGHPDAVVVGAGVNTRMTAEQLPVPTATSFAIAGLEADEDRLLADYLTALDEQLRALETAHGDAAGAGVLAEVEALCATLGREVAVSLPGGTTLEGRAQRIDPDGRLVVMTGLTETAVAAGDVVHVR